MLFYAVNAFVVSPRVTVGYSFESYAYFIGNCPPRMFSDGQIVWPIRRNVNNLINQSDKACDKWLARENSDWFKSLSVLITEMVCFVWLVNAQSWRFLRSIVMRKCSKHKALVNTKLLSTLAENPLTEMFLILSVLTY